MLKIHGLNAVCNISKFIIVSISITLVKFASGQTAPTPQPVYTVVDLTALGANGANSINASGQIAGTNGLQAFLFDGSTVKYLGALGGTQSEAWGINKLGQVTGTADVGGLSGASHAFLYSNGHMSDLGALPDPPAPLNFAESGGQAINDNGQVAGSSGTIPHAVLFSGSTVTDLGTLPGLRQAFPGGPFTLPPLSYAYGINNSGWVVGFSSVDIGAYTTGHAFLYRDASMIDLGSLGGASWAKAINDAGQVVGYSYTSTDMSDGNARVHPFLAVQGQPMQDLGALEGATASQANAINSLGVIVGQTGAGGGRAWVYSGGKMQDLNDLIDPSLGITLTIANAVNDRGQIIAQGFVGSNLGILRSYLLTPMCGMARSNYPPPPTNVPFSINGWTGTYTVTATDGLELDDVALGSRYLASQINLPYFNLNTSDFTSGSGNHCELRPDGTTAPCGARSQLVASGVDQSSIHATYQIDQIPASTSACLVVTQTYTLAGVANNCEPTGSACNRLTPQVTYSYTPGIPTENFSSMDAAQRFQFWVDRTTLGSFQNSGAFFRDNDVISLTTPNRNVLLYGLTSAVFTDPMPTEQYEHAVDGGVAGAVDNYHQTWNPHGPSFPFLDWSFGRWNVGGGCSECVHIHWRWGGYTQYVTPVGSFGGGIPLVTPGQSVYVGVLSSAKETHPAQDFVDLVTGDALGATLGQAFWHDGHSTQPSDTFFNYGLFFLGGGNNSSIGSPLTSLRTIYGGYVYNSTARMFSQIVTIENPSSTSITGPLSLALDSLGSNATLANADGTTQSAPPVGSPYVELDLGASNQMAAGGSVNVMLWFSNPTMKGITYTARVVGGGLP